MNNFYLCNSAALQLKLSKMAFIVYSFLSSGANNQTHSCFHSKDTIAKGCSISSSSVIRATRELCAKGLLEIQSRFRPNGRQTSNLYILVDEPQTKMPSIPPVESKNDKEASADDSYKKVAPAKQQKPIRFFSCSPAAFQMKLSPVELKIHHYLVYRAGKDQACKPSKKEIASDCNVSLSTVFRAIKKLCACGLLDVQKLTRREIYGNNGTSVNLYRLKKPVISPPSPQKHDWKIKRLFYALLSRLTPSLMSWVTPQRTISRRKVTYTLRDKGISSQVAKRSTVHKHSFCESHRRLAAKRPHEKNSQHPKSLSVRPFPYRTFSFRQKHKTGSASDFTFAGSHFYVPPRLFQGVGRLLFEPFQNAPPYSPIQRAALPSNSSVVNIVCRRTPACQNHSNSFLKEHPIRL